MTPRATDGRQQCLRGTHAGTDGGAALLEGIALIPGGLDVLLRHRAFQLFIAGQLALGHSVLRLQLGQCGLLIAPVQTAGGGTQVGEHLAFGHRLTQDRQALRTGLDATTLCGLDTAARIRVSQHAAVQLNGHGMALNLRQQRLDAQSMLHSLGHPQAPIRLALRCADIR